jgi:alpha-L-arabinofuranosidase
MKWIAVLKPHSSATQTPFSVIQKKNPALISIATLLLASVAGLSSEQAVIEINTAQAGATISPRLYGIFLEEINHGVDGGLYAELVRNRAFEDARPPEGYTFRSNRWRDARGADAGYARFGYKTNGIPFWTLFQSGDAKGEMQLQTSGGITEPSAYCMRLDVESIAGGRIGVANQGFFGIGIRQGESYALSLYARGGDGFKGPLSVRLEGASGAACSDEITVKKIGAEWKQFKDTLTATKTDAKARLVITAGAKGKVWLDFVSLFPKKTWRNEPNGLRPDIAQMIADLKPGFVRFPGGCVVEAGTVETAYNWKLTVGPLEQRQERWGPWSYRRTQGTGLYEYLRFCEDLGAEPLYVGFAGQTCIFRERENVPMEDMGWVRDNFLDVIEYANGPANSKWGSLRAKAGRKAPFHLKEVEIGNENQGREFAERYRFVHDAMKAKYPELKYFADLSYSWNSRDSQSNAVYDVEDRHYYNNSRWFMARFNEYDARDRKLPPVYLGEIAVTSGDGGPLRGNLRAALAEGVFLMGCERNADTVQMISYAPLLAHVEGRTDLPTAPPPGWHGMIYFNGTQVFGTVSYHLWKLFGQNRPGHNVQTTVAFPDTKPVTVSGQIGVGTWNTSAEFKDIRVERDGQALYASDFTDTNNATTGWRPDNGGRWRVEDDAYRQSRQGQAFSYFGDESWTNYTLTVKARKLSGGEGFMIVFGRKGGDRYWWNLGGWGNQEHGIEYNQNPVGTHVRGSIETNRWYDVKVEVNGSRIRCYLDGKLLHDAKAPDPKPLFAIAGRDDTTGDLIVKAINVTAEPIPAELTLQGLNVVAPKAQLTLLTSAQLNDNNSLQNPTNVLPKTSEITIAGPKFAHEFPPNSLTVLRLKAK